MEIELVRITSAIVMLSIATFFDVYKREIHDYLWVIFGIFAMVLLFFEQEPVQELTVIGVSMVVAPVALVAWRLGIFGGADAFSLIVLAALVPGLTLTDNIVTPLTTLLNAALLSMVMLGVNMSNNLYAMIKKEDIFAGFDESASKKIAALFLGFRARNPKYGFSIEQTVGGQKKFALKLHDADNTKFCTTANTWVTPGIPFMIFILAGFAIQLFWGDIVFSWLPI